jgi:hypothetical protein
VAQPGGELNLAPESLGAERRAKVGMQHLDGDGTIMLEVVRELDRRHPARAKFALDAIPVGETGTQSRDGIGHLLRPLPNRGKHRVDEIKHPSDARRVIGPLAGGVKDGLPVRRARARATRCAHARSVIGVPRTKIASSAPSPQTSCAVSKSEPAHVAGFFFGDRCLPPGAAAVDGFSGALSEPQT